MWLSTTSCEWYRRRFLSETLTKHQRNIATSQPKWRLTCQINHETSLKLWLLSQPKNQAHESVIWRKIETLAVNNLQSLMDHQTEFDRKMEEDLKGTNKSSNLRKFEHSVEFRDFSPTNIFREIKFCSFRGSKTDILISSAS